MAIPKFEEFIHPVFHLIAKNGPIPRKELRSKVVVELVLSEEDQREKVKSGRVSRWKDRTNWSVSYLKAAGLIEYVKRGVYDLTDTGRDFLNSGETVNFQSLKEFKSFAKFVSGKGGEASSSNIVNLDISNESSPEETFYKTYESLVDQTTDELLQKVKSIEPDEFERLVIDLMVALGYGTSTEIDAFVTGNSADEGVDGIIYLDKLGLEKVYLQAKKWSDTTVGRPEIQKFVGALEGKRAKKGVFLTTSTFSQGAVDYASNVQSEVALIDGLTLVKLMLDSDLGVSVEKEMKIKKIDTDYFEAL